MRRQVIATDLYSRAPSTRTTPAENSQLDHVTPHGWAGGPTSEPNLASLAIPPHQLKTLGLLKVHIGTRRDLTFTTLLGQVLHSRSHDYRQYLTDRITTLKNHLDHTADTHDADNRARSRAEAREDALDLANQTLYAALATRPEHRTGPTRTHTDPDGLGLWLTHTDPTTSQTRPGPRPDHPTLDDLHPDQDRGDKDRGDKDRGDDGQNS